jgi:hypothetical protein
VVNHMYKSNDLISNVHLVFHNVAIDGSKIRVFKYMMYVEYVKYSFTTYLILCRWIEVYLLDSHFVYALPEH